MRTSSAVRRIEVSADGRRVFLLYRERLVVRDVDSGGEFTIASDLGGRETHFVASLDGRRVSLCCGEQLKVWDTSTGALVREWTSDGRICDAHPRMMPDGRRILDPRADGVHLFDIDTAKLRMHLPVPWRPWKIDVSPDGRWIEATSGRYGDAWLESDDPQIVAWDTKTGKPVVDSDESFREWDEYNDQVVPSDGWQSGHDRASASTFTPDHRSVVKGFPDGLVGIGEKGGKKIRWLVGHSARVVHVVVSPDGQRVVSASKDGTVHVCRLDTGAGFAATFSAHAPIAKCVIRPDDQTLVVVEKTGGAHVLPDLLSAPVERLRLEKPLPPIEWVLAPDGSRLFLLYPGSLVEWEVDSGAKRTIVEGLWGDEEALVTSVAGLRVSLRCRGELRVWDVEGGTLARAWRPALDGARMTPDGRGIIDRPRGTSRGLCLFDIDTGKLKLTLSDTTDIQSVQMSGDSRWVAAAASDASGRQQFTIWDTTTGRAVNLVGGTPDDGQFRGHWFAAIASGGSVWDLITGARVFNREDYRRPFTALAVMPDDRGMVVGFGDGRLGIWGLTGESKVRRLPGHAAAIKAIAVAPDGHAIVSASSDGVVQVCAVKSGAVTATYRASGPLFDCVIRPDGQTVVAVEESRRVYVLRELLSG